MSPHAKHIVSVEQRWPTSINLAFNALSVVQEELEQFEAEFAELQALRAESMVIYARKILCRIQSLHLRDKFDISQQLLGDKTVPQCPLHLPAQFLPV